ncbi:MAG: hypothetical protein EHM49_00710 [Deltaproteobacteria bacterium]|nr:MAG: hypothetical protein EHM49_00710 [Deltaproteobacteria bacterium]
MSIMTRSEIIAEARFRAGRKAQEISVTNAFDFILEQCTRDYPILKNICHPFTTVANQSFAVLPSDWRSWEGQQCFYDTYELGWMEPEEYFRDLRVFTDTASRPSKFTIVEDESRLYFWNKPSEAKASYLYYAAIHPKVDRSLSFTSGGTYEIKRGDTVTGATGGGTMLVSFVRVTSGSWAGGDAVGRIMGSHTGAAFQAENLNVGAELNVATIAAAATTDDNFQHFLGERFDEVVIEGVTWKCLESISGKDAVEKALMKTKENDFKDLLRDAASVKNRRNLKSVYRGF